jgi:hypothetical protein
LHHEEAQNMDDRDDLIDYMIFRDMMRRASHHRSSGGGPGCEAIGCLIVAAAVVFIGVVVAIAVLAR